MVYSGGDREKEKRDNSALITLARTLLVIIENFLDKPLSLLLEEVLG